MATLLSSCHKKYQFETIIIKIIKNHQGLSSTIDELNLIEILVICLGMVNMCEHADKCFDEVL